MEPPPLKGTIGFAHVSSTLKPWPFIYFIYSLFRGWNPAQLYGDYITSLFFRIPMNQAVHVMSRFLLSLLLCFLGGFTWNRGGEPNSAYQWLKEISDKTGSGHWAVIFWGVGKMGEIHPSKLTWHWKIAIFHRKHIFKWWIFHCHVSFPGGRWGYLAIICYPRHIPWCHFLNVIMPLASSHWELETPWDVVFKLEFSQRLYIIIPKFSKYIEYEIRFCTSKSRLLQE